MWGHQRHRAGSFRKARLYLGKYRRIFTAAIFVFPIRDDALFSLEQGKILYRFVERPGIALGRHLTKPRRDTDPFRTAPISDIGQSQEFS
jgi:hypothetical protein